MWNNFHELGWKLFPKDENIYEWAKYAKAWVETKIRRREYENSQLRCGGTWFAGVNFLENDFSGGLGNVPLSGIPIAQIKSKYGHYFNKWDKAQVSICYPGYPKRTENESDKAFSYRKDNYGAHVDGIIPVGNARSRYFKEPHAFVLGVVLSDFNEDAAPLIVWEKSHKIIHSSIYKKLKPYEPNLWHNIEVTKEYQTARRLIFKNCRQTTIWAPVGSCFLVHRHSLHGIKPWGLRGTSEAGGRMIAYFRPQFEKKETWLCDQI